MMFLDCPAYLDEDGALRCGLPAARPHMDHRHEPATCSASLAVRCLAAVGTATSVRTGRIMWAVVWAVACSEPAGRWRW
jgi:hypothetical protein